MVLWVIVFYWYCRHIGDSRINLYTDPEWTSITGPASQHSLVGTDTGIAKRPDYYDYHVHYRPEE